MLLGGGLEPLGLSLAAFWPLFLRLCAQETAKPMINPVNGFGRMVQDMVHVVSPCGITMLNSSSGTSSIAIPTRNWTDRLTPSGTGSQYKRSPWLLVVGRIISPGYSYLIKMLFGRCAIECMGNTCQGLEAMKLVQYLR